MYLDFSKIFTKVACQVSQQDLTDRLKDHLQTTLEEAV